MTLSSAALSLLLLAPATSRAQANPRQVESGYAAAHSLPVGTVLPVQIAGHLPMHEGQLIRADLIYPVYDVDTLVLPDHTTLLGAVVSVRPDGSRRLRARLNGDFHRSASPSSASPRSFSPTGRHSHSRPEPRPTELRSIVSSLLHLAKADSFTSNMTPANRSCAINWPSLPLPTRAIVFSS